MALLCAAGWAEAPTLISSVQQAHALSNEQAAKAIPVSLEATVTFYRADDVDLFIQDKDFAIYVLASPGGKFLPGDRVRVEGKTQASFRPDIVAGRITVLHHGALPAPLPVSFVQLLQDQLDCRRVTLRAVVRTADLVGIRPGPSIYLQALMDGGYLDIAVNSNDAAVLQRLIDAEVEVTGVVGAKFDEKMELTGIRIGVQSLDDIKILKPSVFENAQLPFTSMGDILRYYQVRDLSQRVRVRGTLTYYQPGSSAVIQEGNKSLWVSTLTVQPMRVGNIVEVLGFPSVHFGYLGIDHAEVRDTSIWAPVLPIHVGWQEIGYGGNAFSRVVTEGTLVKHVREASRDEYVLMVGGHLVSALYRHPLPNVNADPPPAKAIAEGSKVRVTGISMFYSTDSFNGPIASDLLLQSLDDIEVIASPSLLSIANLVALVLLLLLALLAAGVRGALLSRKLLRQTAAMASVNEAEAALERQRSRILEEINSGRPLAEILVRITGLVSLQLDGAQCWFELTDTSKARLRPPNVGEMRVVKKPISARYGSSHGLLFAAFDPVHPELPNEEETLEMGAKLATLAIENLRLYSDLRHRSDFDQLTDAHNRYALDRHFDAFIAKGKKTGAAFGLIYIDLDGFKSINDSYGHHVGDLYLQKLCQRMKHQSRPQDILARIGGDEFALLVPDVRTREELAEIARRLESCFDQPLAIEGLLLYGAFSSGIALYPEDGATKDALMRVADEAMYAVKTVRQVARENRV
jgi:diguanylate cyclase (GGDEF)-like protein